LKIAIYWEQESWGGVDSHLLELLRTWPSSTDELTLLYNFGNQGFERIRNQVNSIQRVQCKAISSWSYNELLRCSQNLYFFKFLRPLIFVLQPIIFLINILQFYFIFTKLQKSDVLLSNNGGYPAAWGNLAALIGARVAGIPSTVLLVHHAASHPTLFMGWFEHLVDRAISRTVTALVFVSNATRRALFAKRFFNEENLRIRVIHNAISLNSEFSDLGSVGRVDIRQAVGATKEFVIGIIGRIEAYKGHEDIFLALSRLDSDHRNLIKLAVIGTGEGLHLSYLHRLVKILDLEDNIKFLGYLPGDPVRIVAQMDLLISATRSFEGFGLTLMEAMHAGTPLIATRVGAIPEFLDNTNAFLINPSDPLALSEALIRFTSDHIQWKVRAVAARERLKANRQIMALEYRRLFEDCINISTGS
jgi:glycosyltransferase involved in cell wall biosynthesis